MWFLPFLVLFSFSSQTKAQDAGETLECASGTLSYDKNNKPYCKRAGLLSGLFQNDSEAPAAPPLSLTKDQIMCIETCLSPDKESEENSFLQLPEKIEDKILKRYNELTEEDLKFLASSAKYKNDPFVEFLLGVSYDEYPAIDSASLLPFHENEESEGRVIPMNKVKARKYLRKAAYKGLFEAQRYLYRFYLRSFEKYDEDRTHRFISKDESGSSAYAWKEVIQHFRRKIGFGYRLWSHYVDKMLEDVLVLKKRKYMDEVLVPGIIEKIESRFEKSPQLKSYVLEKKYKNTLFAVPKKR